MQITITPGAMRALEKDYMTLRGVPGALLMEHAAQAVCDTLRRRIPGGRRAMPASCARARFMAASPLAGADSSQISACPPWARQSRAAA